MNVELPRVTRPECYLPPRVGALHPLRNIFRNLETFHDFAYLISVRKNLDEAGFAQVHTRAGDGYFGWPEEAPFDAIVITAAPDKVPQTLFDQLKPGGILVAPVGPEYGVQNLLRYRNDEGTMVADTLIPVVFVPMTGETERKEK